MKKLIVVILLTGSILHATFLCAQTSMIKHRLNELGNESDITFFAPDNSGGWFIVYEGGSKAWWSTIPENQKVIAAIQDIHQRNYKIKSITFTPDGLGYVIVVEDNGFWYENIPNSLITKLRELNDLNKTVDFIQFSNGKGWVVVYDNGFSYESQDFPETVGYALKLAYEYNLKIKSLSFTPTGGWLLLFGDYHTRERGINPNALETLSKLYKNKTIIKQVCFTEFNETFINTEQGVYHDFMDNSEIGAYMNSTNDNLFNWFEIDVNNIYSNGRKLTPKFNLHSDNVLTIEKAYIRDNGEHSSREPAAIGIWISYSDDEVKWTDYGWAGELIGKHYEGDEGNGKAKLEWRDFEKVKYSNYGILDWDAFPDAKQLRITLIEGDHESAWWAKIVSPVTGSAFKNDIVFDSYISVAHLKTGRLLKLKESDATIWLKTKRLN